MNQLPEFIQKIQAQLKEKLPGVDAQYEMAHRVRHLEQRKAMVPPKDVRVAAVLCYLFEIENEWHITLMKRTARGPHSGQISFPGGGREAEDHSLSETALREANEEVGIMGDETIIVGELSNLYIPVSNSLVYPFVAYGKETDYTIDPEEVVEAFNAPLTDLLNPDLLQNRDVKINETITLKQVPYFNVNGHVVWGATAMILNELLHVIRSF